MNIEAKVPVGAQLKPQASRHAALSWLIKYRWFGLFVVLPTLLAAIYYLLITPDIYVSESRFVIKSSDERRPQLSGLASFIVSNGLSNGQEQSNEILEFIRSRDALADLQKQIDVRKRFEFGHNFIAGFPPLFSDKSFEALYKFYGNMVGAGLDPETGTAVLTVEAYTPKDAYTINENLLKLSEALVNKLNVRAESQAIAEAQKQVNIASDRAKQASLKLTNYRNQSDLIDPAKQAAGVLEVSYGLLAKRAAMQAQLDTMLRDTPRNPGIPTLRNQIRAISAQIGQQQGSVVGTSGGIASKLGNYEDLTLEQKFANESLTAANAALVQARADAQRQKFYLERIVDPNTPDSSRLPHRLMNIITVAVTALCLYFIGWMLVVGILEHAPEE
ncbi:MAG: capsule biosynthesis protein [Sphingomonadales bacterium]|nr:capsule biosynthesis protein [Sphingomonadales bacterium]MDE2569272.1 capsule biosynthesis protein [Sphingomonadales bacterium]